MNIKHTIAILLALLSVLNVSLEAQPIDIQIQLKNTPAVLSQWQDKPNCMRVRIRNNTRKLIAVTPFIEISNSEGSIANNSSINSQIIELGPGLNTFYANKLFPARAINYIRATPNKAVAAGTHEVCISLESVGEVLLKPVRACASWMVEPSNSSEESPIHYSVSALYWPVDKLKISQRSGLRLYFSWSPVQPTPNFPVTYMLQVYPIDEGQTPQEAISTQQAILSHSVVGTNTTQWPSTIPLAKSGHYVWTVRPYSSTGEPLMAEEDIGNIFRFEVDVKEVKQIPRTADGLYHIDFDMPPALPAFTASNKEYDICWTPIPQKGLQYQLHYEKLSCDWISKDEGAYPFPAIITTAKESAKINQLSTNISQLEAELRLWENFSVQQIHNLQKAEDKQLNWQLLAGKMQALSMSWEGILFPIEDMTCDLEEECCGEYSCCQSLNPCNDAERELYLARMICMENKLRSLMDRQTYHLLSFLGLFTRMRLHADKWPTQESYSSYFELINGVIQLVAQLEQTGDGLRSLKEVLTHYPILAQQAPTLLQQMSESEQPKDQWQKLASTIQEAGQKGKMPPSQLLAALDEYFQYRVPIIPLGQTRQGISGDVQQHLNSALELTQCLIRLNSRKIENLRTCGPFINEVIKCIARSKRLLEQELAITSKRGIDERNAYWAWVSDSIQTAFKAVIGEMGTDWIRNCCEEGGKVFLPGPLTPCAEELRDRLSEKLGRKICYLKLEISLSCESDTLKTAMLTHSFPLLYPNANCCDEETRLSWQLPNPIPAQDSVVDSLCVKVSADDILESFKQQQRLLNSQQAPMSYEGIQAGRWWVSAHDQAGVMLGYSPQRFFDTPVLDQQAIVLAPEDTTDCGCQVAAYLDEQKMVSNQLMILDEQDKLHTIRLSGDCEGGCPADNAYISIQQPSFIQYGVKNTFSLDMPRINFGGNSMSYNFPEAGIYRIKVAQVCNGSLCEESFMIKVLKAIPQTPSYSAWTETKPVEQDAFCLQVLYKAESETEWKSVRFNQLKLEGKAKVELKVESSCLSDCEEEQKKYQWKIITPNEKRQTLKGMSDIITYSFKKTGTYRISVQGLSACPEQSDMPMKFFQLTLSN